MKMPEEQFEIIKRWMYRNARPLDIARWKYHFENGSKEDVLTALAAYQNSDGGFGHALEADSWNPNSAPIQTWKAIEILNELEITDKNNEIVKGILSYLDSRKDFYDGYWYAEIPSNNDYPHAPWWTYGEDVIEDWGYNPTICLAGFILYFADKQSEIYKLAVEIANKAVNEFLKKDNIENMHTISCFLRCFEYCKKAAITDIFDINEMYNCLRKQIKASIGESKERWKNEYVCKPSRFMITPDSVFYTDNKKLADYEVEFIIKSMNPDGTWDVNWDWSDYKEQWAISKNWWNANQTLLNLIYLKGYKSL